MHDCCAAKVILLSHLLPYNKFSEMPGGPNALYDDVRSNLGCNELFLMNRCFMICGYLARAARVTIHPTIN